MAPIARARGRLVITGLVCVSIAIAMAIVATAQTPIGSSVIVFVLGGSILLNLIGYVLRLVTTKVRKRVFLLGRYQFAIGVTKLIGVLTVGSLALLLAIGLLVGRPYNEVALAAFVRGIVAFGFVSLIANGLLDLLIVARHFQGTLAATSTEQR